MEETQTIQDATAPLTDNHPVVPSPYKLSLLRASMALGADAAAAADRAESPNGHDADANWTLECSGAIASLESGGEIGIVGSPRWSQGEAVVTELEAVARALALSYAQDGLTCLKFLGGHFALIIADAANGVLQLANDRIGSYSLYYRVATVEGIETALCGLAIEDINTLETQLSSAESTPRPVLPQAVYHYMYFHMVPSEGTVFADCKKLPIASHVSLSSVGQSPVKYFEAYGEKSKRAAALCYSGDPHGQLRELLAEVVSDNMQSGARRVGAFLSGGLDSSSVVGMMSEAAGGRDVEAFAIGFDADGYDEMPYARLTAKHFGVKLNEYYLTPDDVVDALPRLAASTGEPFGNSSIIPTYFCAKLAAQAGFDVLLAGDGGDELFAGNTRYTQQLVFERYRKLPGFLRKGMLEPAVRLTPDFVPLASKAKSFVAQACTDLPERLHTYNFMHRESAETVFTQDFLQAIDPDTPRREQAAVFAAIDQSPLSQMLCLDWQYTLADNDLRKVRHACQFAGIDVRFPLLDDALLAFSTTLSDEQKLSSGELRGFYKDALRGWLPDDTISKSKHGFGLPFGVWMSTHKPLRDIAHGAIADLQKRQMFRPEFLQSAIDAHGSVHAAYYGELVWILTVLELWLQARESA